MREEAIDEKTRRSKGKEKLEETKANAERDVRKSQRERESHVTQSTWLKVCLIYRGTRMVEELESRVITCHSALPSTYTPLVYKMSADW